MTEMDERQLIEQAKYDPQAFALLYDRYVDRIYAFVAGQTSNASIAADITSATFEKALRNIQRFHWRGTSIGAWLYRIARNEMARHYRRERLLHPISRFWRSDTDIERETQEAEQRTTLHVALGRLRKQDRELLTLRFFEELSNAELAEVFGCSPAAVSVRIHRALRRLKQQFEALEQNGAIYAPRG